MAPEPPKSISYVWKGFGEVAAREGWSTFVRGLTPTCAHLSQLFFPALADTAYTQTFERELAFFPACS